MASTKTLTLTVNNQTLVFDVTLETYNKFVDEMRPDKKTGPYRNFLMRTVRSDNKEALKELLDLPGATTQIASALLEEYMPDIEIRVGE